MHLLTAKLIDVLYRHTERLQTPYHLAIFGEHERLPTLSGTDVVRRLRADGHRQVPILVVSGSARQLTNLRDDELRPGTWLEKPIKPRDLVRIVREHLAACL